MIESDTPLQAKIKELLAERGWNQRQASQRAGLNAGYVNNMLKAGSQTPQRRALEKLARAFGVETEELVRLSLAQTYEREKISEAPELTHEDIKKLNPMGALVGVAEMMKNEPGRWRAFIHHPAAPFVRSLPGAPHGDLILVDTAITPSAGQVALVHSARGATLCYVADPFLIGMDEGGRVGHEVMGARGVEIVGRVVMRVGWG